MLHRALLRVKSRWKAGEDDTEKLLAAGGAAFAEEKTVRLDYFEIVNSESLEPVENVAAGALVAVAAFVGPTRLIDNVLLAMTFREGTLEKG